MSIDFIPISRLRKETVGLRFVRFVDRSQSVDWKFEVRIPAADHKCDVRSHTTAIQLFISFPMWAHWTSRRCPCSGTTPYLSQTGVARLFSRRRRRRISVFTSRSSFILQMYSNNYYLLHKPIFHVFSVRYFVQNYTCFLRIIDPLPVHVRNSGCRSMRSVLLFVAL